MKKLIDILLTPFYPLLIAIHWDEIKKSIMEDLKKEDLKNTLLQQHSLNLKRKVREAIVEYKIATGIKQVDISTYSSHEQIGNEIFCLRTDVTINITE